MLYVVQGAGLSWCWYAREKLQEAGQAAVWRERAVPENWKSEAKAAVRVLFQQQSEELMRTMPHPGAGSASGPQAGWTRLFGTQARRLDALLGEPCQLLPEALQAGDVALFLGDGWLGRLPPQLAQQADATVCNFLKLAWKARQSIWQDFCCEGDEWKLKEER